MIPRSIKKAAVINDSDDIIKTPCEGVGFGWVQQDPDKGSIPEWVFGLD